MPENLKFTISADCAGTRLDRCLSRLIPGSSRAYLQKLIRDGLVQGDGEVLTLPRYPVRDGMEVTVTMPDIRPAEAPEAEDFEFPILYEDEWMLVINKPAGVVVHPAAGNPTGTVVNALLGRYPDWGESFSLAASRPGIVHRLDKDTSGCLVVAKTPEAQFRLGTAFAERKVKKRYFAVVRGIPARASGEIITEIGRHPVNRQKMAVVERGGKLAITRNRVERNGMIDGVAVSTVQLEIATGRTHQIRVHMANLGHPVLGDPVYGGARAAVSGVTRQLLHAWKISLPHPGSGETIEFIAPLPRDIAEIVERISD